MKQLLQHASRSLVAHSVPIATPARSFASRAPSICSACLCRAADADSRRGDRAQWRSNTSRTLSARNFWSSNSKRDLDDGKPPQAPGPSAIRMPPPATLSTPVQRPEIRVPEDKAPNDKIVELFPSVKSQEPSPREEASSPVESLKDVKQPPPQPQAAPELPRSQAAPKPPPTVESQQIPQEPKAPTPKQHEVVDNINRVPDEHLPSHRERQRWSLSKRFSNIMDDLLPKLAVVTQKVNTYTGTDYSGVEALRREIQEQEKLVKARRLAIESAKNDLDTALAHQAASQKKVVALLERKHSWSAGDLESYMALIRSEHTNDQGVRESKEAVTKAEDALEEARGQLEKRERAQYHEEQIWSDTIRRNSTWVTFGLMGVNIFLLLLSLLVFEPWRRRRMVREIKTVLETQKMPTGIAPATAIGGTTASALSKQNIAIIEEEIDKVFDSENVPVTVPPAAEKTQVAPPEDIFIVEEPASRTGWKGIVAAAQDIVSDRVILIRRIDYTAAVLQGAATGAILAATILAWFQHR